MTSVDLCHYFVDWKIYPWAAFSYTLFVTSNVSCFPTYENDKENLYGLLYTSSEYARVIPVSCNEF